MIRTNNRFGVSAAVAAGMLAEILLVLLLWPALPAQAQGATGAPITVNTTKDETTPNDGLCSLREALQNANGGAQTSSDC